MARDRTLLGARGRFSGRSTGRHSRPSRGCGRGIAIERHRRRQRARRARAANSCRAPEPVEPGCRQAFRSAVVETFLAHRRQYSPGGGMSSTMRYRVRHETVYHYGGNVAHSHQLLHLSPRDSATQRCHSRSITLVPEPGTRRDDVDAFGNFVTRLEYELPHDRLEVLAEVGVEISAPRDVRDGDCAAWEEVRGALTYSGQPMSAAYLDACRFRMESSHVRVKQTFS